MRHRILILGAGYAGTTAAGRLARRLHEEDVELTLVNAEPDFVERIRLHQVATGTQLPRRPLPEMVQGTGVRLRIARVTGVDADARTVSLVGPAGPAELPYDTLVYALGSSVDDRGVPGVAEHAHDAASRPGALRLQERLAGLPRGGRVLVVGGGLTGIEVASEIAERRDDLRVAIAARGAFGAWLSASGQQHLRSVFDRLGALVHEHTEVVRVGATSVQSRSGATIPAEVTVWTAGFAVHPIAAAAGLAVTAQGRIVVGETMRSVSHPDVYAVGDAAQAKGPQGNLLRMSCASGIPMAWQAADSIAARLTGGRARHAPLAYVHQCISLGRRDGLIQLVTSDDRSRAFALGGRLAAGYKEMICAGAAFLTVHPFPYPVRRRRVLTPAASAARKAPVDAA